MIDRKTLARFIDNAAARADIVDAEPASPKQCWFLAGLIVKADLTRRRASLMIGDYLKG